MWFACIACPGVFQTQAKLDNHYSTPSGKACHKVLQIRNKFKRYQTHKLPATATDQTNSNSNRVPKRRSIRNNPDLETGTIRPIKKLYFCPTCSATFDDEETHKKSHEIPCDLNTNADLKKLYTCAQLIKKENEQVKCPYCDNTLPTNKRLKGHIFLMHPDVRETLLNLIKEVESLGLLSKSDSEKEKDGEVAGPSTKANSRPPHFSTQEYKSSEVPSWAVDLQKLKFVSQILLPKSSIPVPLSSVPPNLEESPESPSLHHKENAKNESSGKEDIQSPLSIQVDDAGVKTRSQAASPATATKVLSSPKATESAPKKSKPEKKRLCHLCFFCAKRFHRESEYLVHIMFNHTKPRTKADFVKLRQYIEILSTRLEIESIGSPTRGHKRLPTPDQTNEASEPAAKRGRPNPEKVAQLVLEDIGYLIARDCPACEESVTLSSTISHMEAHLGVARAEPNDLACLICKFKAKDSIRLKEHVASEHFQVKPFSCTYCWTGFAQRSTLQLHIARRHREIKEAGQEEKRD